MKFGILTLNKRDYAIDNLAIRELSICFLGIPIYRGKITTTDNNTIKVLTIKKEPTKVCGFTLK